MTHFLDGIKLNFDDVLIVPRRTITSSRKEVDLIREFKFYHSSRVLNCFPIIVSNMDTVGCFDIARVMDEFNGITCLHKYYTFNDLKEFFKYTVTDYAWATIGMSDGEIDKLEQLRDFGRSLNICIDVANGHMDSFVEYCATIRSQFADSIIMAGNVCTAEMVQELIIHGGVDIVKVGIGSGSPCQTSSVTGIGYPQLSTILECSNVAHGLKREERRLGLVCSDGGCKTSGDICKAIGAGADFVMCGGLFLGASECSGEWSYKPEMINKRVVEGYGHKCEIFNPIMTGNYLKDRLRVYGMSSYAAQEKYGGKKDYRASEGKVFEVAHKGPIKNIIKEIQGGLRSCCSYVGATSLKDLAKCTTFVRINK